jgi:hypothetical protein
MFRLEKQRENTRQQAASEFQQALSLFHDNKLGINEIQRKTETIFPLYRVNLRIIHFTTNLNCKTATELKSLVIYFL